MQADRNGEFFEVARSPGTNPEVAVLDVQAPTGTCSFWSERAARSRKFLCGHDERHWFVAAIPESAPVGTVLQAKEALKPPDVRVAQAREGLGAKSRNRRKNTAYLRQGEWFFLPVQRHACRREDSCCTTSRSSGGTAGSRIGSNSATEPAVRRSTSAGGIRGGVSLKEYQRILSANPEAKCMGLADHAAEHAVSTPAEGFATTTTRRSCSRGWHAVLMNTEGQAKAMESVVFLD